MRREKRKSYVIPLTPYFFNRFVFQQEKYIEIVQAKEAKCVAEDMQLRDLKVKLNPNQNLFCIRTSFPSAISNS